MKKIRFIAVAACWLAGFLPASAQVQNTRLISNLTLGADSETRDLWADGNYIYVARGNRGLDIINAAVQSNPVRVANVLPFAHADMGDVMVRNGIAYVANQVANNSPTPWVGLFMYDVSNPALPVEVGRIAWGAGAWYHLGASADSVYVDVIPGATIAYLASDITGDVEIFDVSNPALPVYLGEIVSPIFSYYSQAHDMVVANGRCYTAWLGGGFTVHDVSNPANPILLAHQPNASVSGVFTYHLWPIAGGQFLCTTEESATGPDGLRIWNLSNLASITLASSYNSPNGAIPHSVMVNGRFAYLSWFEDGLRVLDISNPYAIRSVGWYDPDPAPAHGNLSGGWGVFPFQNNVYLSHMTRGLYIIDFVDTITITNAEWDKHTRVLSVEATSSAAPSANLSVAGYGAMTYSVSLNRYSLTRTPTSMPASVTVTSDLGQTATSSVRKR